MSNWVLFGAYVHGRRVGGAAGVFRTPTLAMLEGRTDLAILWDIRVSADARGKGIGSALFDAVERWAMSKDCLELKIETQNTNVAACKFYQRKGCALSAVNRGAYPGLPDEVQLLWNKMLG
jgi:GNAT superfamily N-acetyltransferase